MVFPKKCDCCDIGVIKEPREICEICGWEDDVTQRKDPDFSGGANALSLNEYKLKYSLEYGLNSEPNYKSEAENAIKKD